jgi:ribosome biogenesis GTPase
MREFLVSQIRRYFAILTTVNFEALESKLVRMGWNDFFRAQLSEEEFQNAVVARVVEPLRGLSRVATAEAEIWAESTDSVGVGDWVVGKVRNLGEGELRFSVTRILTRKTKLSRRAPSQKNYEQILCANAEFVFVVVAMTQELNLAGIERAISVAKAGGLSPVVVLTKADACADPDTVVIPVKKAAAGAPLHLISTAQGVGLEALATYFGTANTVVLLGASGAGKSTLTNYFVAAQAQSVGGTRERDEKGRHTTTARRLHFLPTGGMIVDSPGIRELQPWVEPAATEAPAKSNSPKKARPPKRGARYYDDDDSDY